MIHCNRSFTAGLAYALLESVVLALMWISFYLIYFVHMPPFYWVPLTVIHTLVGSQWIFGSYHALSEKQSGSRDHLKRYFALVICVIAFFVVIFAITGKTLDVSIGQGFLLPLLLSGSNSDFLMVWSDLYIRRIPSELFAADPVEFEWLLRRPHDGHQRRLKSQCEWLLVLASLPLLAALFLSLALFRALQGDNRLLLKRINCLGLADEPFEKLRFASNPFRVSGLIALPLLWNVLRGEMALIGSRLARSVDQVFPEASDLGFRPRARLHPEMIAWGRLSGAALEEVDDALRWELQRDLFDLSDLSFDVDLRVLLRGLLHWLSVPGRAI
tara:strand:- start:2594 stop:3580 length:987 start_codon:yes stop_codon:yes gene_type:complete